MAGKYWWIKERDNPQFKNPYFLAYGRITVAAAKRMEEPLYGNNYMHKFDTEVGYLAAIKMWKARPALGFQNDHTQKPPVYK